MSDPVLRFRRDMTMAAIGLLLILAWEASGGDWVVASHYGSATGFAARHAPWAVWLHEAGRWLSNVVGAVCLVRALWPERNAHVKRAAWACFAGTVLSALLVSSIKYASATACPWSLQAFGGSAAYASHWIQWGHLASTGGGCFPSGHASAAFAFFPLYTLWRDRHHRWPTLGLLLTGGFGVAFGWLQVARGAHFVSHVMWSAWLCWVIAAVLARVVHGAQTHENPGGHLASRLV